MTRFNRSRSRNTELEEGESTTNHISYPTSDKEPAPDGQGYQDYKHTVDKLITPIIEHNVENDDYPQKKFWKIPSPNFYKHFLDGKPEYLVRNYWWAYLWPLATWFFDHQPIINAILFGQYKNLTKATVTRLQNLANESILQLTCVYGVLTPTIIKTVSPAPLHITDVATVQLERARSKAPVDNTLHATRMNAEHLGYKDNCFSTVILFFLLHEMPEYARINVLSECMRVIPAGGTLLVTEYAPLPTNHLIYRFPLSRWIITRLEPFLDSFWHTDVTAMLNQCGKDQGKKVVIKSDERIFAKFYRVTEYRIVPLES